MKTTQPFLFMSCFLLVCGLLSSCQPPASNPTATTVLPTPSTAVMAEPTHTPLPTDTPTIPPPPSEDEMRTAIIQALLALNTQPNRTEVTTVLEDGQERKNVIEFVPPDKKRILDAEQGIEYIIIDPKVFARTEASGKWEETQISAATFLGEGEVTEASIGQTIQEVRFLRKDSLNGQVMLLYEYTSKTHSGDIELNSQTELWVGESDGLPYKMVIDGEILSASTDPGTGKSTLRAVKALTTTLIFFDPAIKIEAPRE